MPTIIDGSASATFATPLPLSQGGTGNTSGNVVSSQVAGALNATGSAPLYACRAWVNFNGTGTVAIRASGNVSSITDNGNGDYTVNFATAMPGADYAFAAGISSDDSGYLWAVENPLGGVFSATAFRIQTATQNGSTTLFRRDTPLISVAFFR